jgi:hypothetical protein
MHGWSEVLNGKFPAGGDIMCSNNVGVAKRIDVENLSKEIADLVKILDKEVAGAEVNVPVQHVKNVTKALEKIIAEK